VHAALPAFAQWSGATIPLFLARTDLGSDDASLVPLSLRGTEQEREEQADALALQALSRAGFDASSLLTYLEREWPRNTVPSQADRAATSKRLARLRETLASLTAVGDGRLSSSAFVLVQDRIRAEQAASAKRTEVPSLLSRAK
jgi:predicted Zn-dependent protease